jgi:hypothetical protein
VIDVRQMIKSANDQEKENWTRTNINLILAMCERLFSVIYWHVLLEATIERGREERESKTRLKNWESKHSIRIWRAISVLVTVDEIL